MKDLRDWRCALWWLVVVGVVWTLASCGKNRIHPPVISAEHAQASPKSTRCQKSALDGEGSMNQQALQCWVNFLAGPELRGRANGSPGGALARDAIEAVFKEVGLKPAGDDGYRQAIPSGANVLGLIPGQDPAHRDEVIVVGAHYDHLGELGDKVYPGADDNASAVAIMLEWLRAQHARGWAPARTILVAAFDAEEPPDFRTKAMGSQVFVDRPTIDRERIKAMVCMDLMGGDLWEGYRSPLFVMGLETFATSPLGDGNELRRAVPAGIQLPIQPLHLRAVEDLPTGRRNFSDYGPFRDVGIPVVFLSTGRTKHYHQTSDRPGTLLYDKMEASQSVLDAILKRLASPLETLQWTDEQPMHIADALAGIRLHRAALGRVKDVPPSPEVTLLSRWRITGALDGLEPIVRGHSTQATLNEKEASTVIKASLRMQCLLAPDTLMPPAACLLL